MAESDGLHREVFDDGSVEIAIGVAGVVAPIIHRELEKAKERRETKSSKEKSDG